jgi:acetate kinase
LNILALNSGSSSLKFGLYRVESSRIDNLLSGEAESIGGSKGKFRANDSRGHELVSANECIPTQQEAIVRIGEVLARSNLSPPVAVGHRVVHGGPGPQKHCLIDEDVLRRLEAAVAFAPLHTPATLAVIRSASERFPGLPQVACFDTAFHAQMPDVARVLPIPGDLRSEGVHRYGFHGLSCESIVNQLGGELPERMIIAHLGNGASVTAVRRGKSIDTSMGLTPSGGLMMGTRSGDLDPGVLIYLLREKNLDAAKLEDLLDRRSGLLGISGISSDMRSLHEAALSSADARLAIQMFCSSACKQIAAMISVLDGVDLIVFTGGIGENDAAVRNMICDGLAWIGVTLDEARNRDKKNPVNAAVSRCSVRVLASLEDEQIAGHTWALTPQRHS